MILNVHQFIVLLGAGLTILDWGYMSCTRPPYFFYIARAFAVLEGIGLSHSLGNCQAGQCSNMFQLPPAAILAQATIHPTLWSTSACLQHSWVSVCLCCWFAGGPRYHMLFFECSILIDSDWSMKQMLLLRLI